MYLPMATLTGIMPHHHDPWKQRMFVAVTLAGWMNRQQYAISHLKEENRILREKLDHTRTATGLREVGVYRYGGN
jgi:hypothetical protein